MNSKRKNRIKSLLFTSEKGHRIYSFFGSFVRKKRKHLTDEEYVKLVFEENTGTTVDLNKPATFNDKLLWLSLYDRVPLKTKCADKYMVREYVCEKGYQEILTTLYGVYDSTEEINLDDMPEKFFVKTNHDSGTYALIDKKNKESLKAFKRIEKALHRNYYYESREWQYKDITPKVICEEYIECGDPWGLIDYRFYCFDGEIGFIAIDIGTTDQNGNHIYDAKRNIYDENFCVLNAKLKRDHFDPKLLKKPCNFEAMKKIAKDLSAPFKHVRVDLYNVSGRIIFAELTFCNGGGMQLLEPYDFNVKIGEMISLGNDYE